MFYPSLLGAFIIWFKVFKKKKFKDYMLGLPKIPEKGERWFLVMVTIGYCAMMGTYIFLLAVGLAIVINNYRHAKSVDSDEMATLKR